MRVRILIVLNILIIGGLVAAAALAVGSHALSRVQSAKVAAATTSTTPKVASGGTDAKEALITDASWKKWPSLTDF